MGSSFEDRVREIRAANLEAQRRKQREREELVARQAAALHERGQGEHGAARQLIPRFMEAVNALRSASLGPEPPAQAHHHPKVMAWYRDAPTGLLGRRTKRVHAGWQVWSIYCYFLVPVRGAIEVNVNKRRMSLDQFVEEGYFEHEVHESGTESWEMTFRTVSSTATGSLETAIDNIATYIAERT